MTCGGCSGAVERVLKKTEGRIQLYSWSGSLTNSVHVILGISECSVSLEKQEVLVTGTIGYDDLLAKIQKTGKEVRLLCFQNRV